MDLHAKVPDVTEGIRRNELKCSYQSALICDLAITSHQRIACDCLPEYLHSKDISDDVFRLAIDICVSERNVVIANYAIAQG